MREDPAENEETANDVQKIGTNGQNAKALKKSINWVNKMNIIGKDCINKVLPLKKSIAIRLINVCFRKEGSAGGCFRSLADLCNRSSHILFGMLKSVLDLLITSIRYYL